MKKYVIFAGVNGAGKTTLFQTNDEYRMLARVNLDEIIREFGSWRNMYDVSRAGMMAIEMIQDHLEKGDSFTQETTLCGHSIFRNIQKAKEYGYRVELNFVGLDSVNLAIQRVEIRVKNGGHGIPREDIKRRYGESQSNLKKAIKMCDCVRVFDNTDSFRKVLSFENGICVDRAEDIPEWCNSLLE